MIIRSYKNYRKVENWLEVIPDHWKLERIKSLFDQISVKGKKLKEGTYIPLENIQSFTGKLLSTSSNENGEETLLFKKGDLLFMKLRPYLAKVLLAEFDGGVSGEVIVNRKKKTKNTIIFNRYFFYRFLSTQFIFKVNSLTDGVKMPRTNPSKISALEIAVPPFEEQRAISNFLDNETACIDKKIDILETKILAYKELIKSLKYEAIYKGLNKHIPLKDSNIDWIGEIPNNWNIARGKDLFKEKSRKGHPNEPLLAASQKQGVVLKTMLQSKSMEAQKDFENFKLVEIDDFVISLRSFEGGIETAYYKGIISPVYSVFAAKGNLHVSYFKHLFKSSMFISNLKTMVTGIRDGQSIKFVEIQNTFFPIPPLEEQVAIAKYLDEKIGKIEILILNITKQIKGLKEFRKSLINDVVNGKLKVTE